MMTATERAVDVCDLLDGNSTRQAKIMHIAEHIRAAEAEAERRGALAEREAWEREAQVKVEIPCPDGLPGCEVFHFRDRTPEEVAAAIRARADA